ncbi:carboxyltransferase domain-containing protein [Pseudomonas oryzihabitans]|uniref:carboxyltransferase domain-containing protein n=1 Tax=Pseudomonas oryzihabitans TaxID=47885 RepID=UPI003CF52BD8
MVLHFSSRAYAKARSLAWVPSTVAIGNRAAAAADCGLSEEELIALHGAEVTVLMLGFASGHPYLGHYDERLALPRRRMPRTQVPAGSLGLANRQSVIYPKTLPGGWSLIGRTL